MQEEFRIKKNGFMLYPGCIRCKISNRYGAAAYGDVEVTDISRHRGICGEIAV